VIRVTGLTVFRPRQGFPSRVLALVSTAFPIPSPTKDLPVLSKFPQRLLIALTLLSLAFGCDNASKLESFQQRHGQGLSVARDMAGNIKAIRFEAAPLTDADLLLLAGADSVREISGDASGVTDAGFAALAECRQLQSLQLKACRFSDTAAKSIAALSQLSSLDLTAAADITPERLATLSQNAQLNELCLRDTSVDDACLASLPAAKLKSLCLAGTTLKLTAAAASSLRTTAPDLEVLQLDGLAIDAETLLAIAALPKLAELSLKDCSIDDTTLAPLVNCKLLRVLDISENPALSDSSIHALGALPELRTINVSGSKFTGAGFSDSGFPALAALVADRTQVKSDALRSLKLPTLFSLSLNGCSLTEKEIRAVFSTNDQTAVSFDQQAPAEESDEKVRGQI
jgi:hypothetical protein